MVEDARLAVPVVESVAQLYAGFFPDGRIIFTKESDLFVAEKDGSGPRKLVSDAGSIWGPRVSPDGRRRVFTIVDQTAVTGSMAAATD